MLSNVPIFAIGLLNIPHVDWQFNTQPTRGACLAMNNKVNSNIFAEPQTYEFK